MLETTTKKRRRPFRILFVCTGNTCRSPMAVGVLRTLLGSRFGGTVEIDSAGTHASSGERASEGALDVCKAHGIDISRHRTRRLSKELMRKADLILVMQRSHMEAARRLCPSKAEHIMLLGELGDTGHHETGPRRQKLEILDPIGGTSRTYADCFGRIETDLKNGLDFLGELVTSRGIRGEAG